MTKNKDMKTIKTKLFVVLGCMLLPITTANCSDKKTVEKAETTEATAKTENVTTVPSPPYKKFVVVTKEGGGLHKKADTNSPTLVKWYEADCESDFCETFYLWSNQPGKPGFELDTDIIDYEGRVFPVLGEEGQFYKVCTLNIWCDIESAYISKANVGDIECAPINADQLEAEDNYLKCRVVKDGKYKGFVLIDNYDELEGETLQVGVLNDGYVATPSAYNIDCQMPYDFNESMQIEEEEGNFKLLYNKSLKVDAEEGEAPEQLDPKKLSPEQVTKIIDMVTRKKPEFMAYMYHFPAMGLQSFYYMAK